MEKKVTEQHSYEELLKYVIGRVNEEFGDVKKFSSSDVASVIFPNSSTNSIRNYLSLPKEGNEKKNKSYKFLSTLFAYYKIELKKEKIVKIQINYLCNLN